MKKKLILGLLIVTIFILAFTLTGCNGWGSNDKDGKDRDGDKDLTWTPIEAPMPTDVYNRLLSGFMNVATDFSARSLNSSPVLGADAKLKIDTTDLDLWLSFKANYDNNNKRNAMFAIELSTKEDSFDDVVLGLYMCNEVMYATIGDTKFKYDMPLSKWNNFFPFDMALDNSKSINNVAAFMYMVLAVKDDKINGKTRLNGIYEEYNYNFSLDLAGTLAKVQNYITKTETDAELVAKINKIFANVLGLTVEQIKEGRVPESQLDIDFTIFNTKLSSLKCNIQIDQSGENANTLFKGEDIDIKIELLKFSTSKSNVSIDFVNSQEKKDLFADYLSGDYAFSIAVDVEKIFSQTLKKDYNVVLSAKIFQRDALDNFLFLEFYDKQTKALEKAMYVYDNEFYTFDLVDGALACTTYMPLDLTAVATAVYENEFGDLPEEGSFNLFNTISYVIGVLKIDAEGFLFNINDKLFTEVWFNYDRMLEYIDSLMVEDIFSEDYLLDDFESFIRDYDTIANFVFESEFLRMITNEDALITAAIARMESADPLHTFTPEEVGGEGEQE